MNELLSDNSGGLSTTRVLSFIVVICIMTVWVKASWITNTLAPISAEQMILLLGTLGLKVAQRAVENKTP